LKTNCRGEGNAIGHPLQPYQNGYNDHEMKKSLNFEKVVLLGRTFAEYSAYFGLSPEYLKGKKILDVGGGVSSFCAEANSMGIYTKFNENYISGGLPKLCIPDKEFDISLVSYLLFLYSDRLNLDFHIKSILELIRISKQEVRIYPLTTVEGKKSRLIKECLKDKRLTNMDIEIKKVNFEFFKNSNEVMIIKPTGNNVT